MGVPNVTIEDVAAAAGVSRSTASRALAGHPSVRAATRERVQAVAERLDYRADPVARALRAGTSGLIGLVLTNLSNPSIQTVAETIQSIGHENDLEVLIATTNGAAERERRVISALTSHRVDGLIVMGSPASASLLNSLYLGGLPLVELIRLPEDIETPSVVYDDRAAGQVATEHLIARGHRRIAFIGGPPETRSGRERYLGYAEALSAVGLGPAPGRVLRGLFHSAFGADATRQLIEWGLDATGLVIANHEAMFGALQVLSQFAVDIPGRLSVVAVEDEALLRVWHPPVTAVDTRPVELATAAMAAMTRQLARGRSRTPQASTAPVVMPVELVERHSVAAPSS
jgi:LacI family transcriptional regulator